MVIVRVNAAIADGIITLGLGFLPFPALGLHDIACCFQLGLCQLQHQNPVRHIPLVGGIEQVALDNAARRHIGLDGDELGQRLGERHRLCCGWPLSCNRGGPADAREPLAWAADE
jgi:hypothetical protein